MRYYPTGSVLEAQLESNPSYIWRNIFQARDMVKTGSRWRVGSGDQIYVLEQPQLLDIDHRYITSDQVALQGVCVNNLMKAGSQKWDVGVIENVFNIRDKCLIYSIPLDESVKRDSWYWLWEKDGDYTVKSAYKYLQVCNGRWCVSYNSGFGERSGNWGFQQK